MPRFTQVDAFADRPFTGNPAAVIPLDTWLPDTVLTAIAAENNLSETAFLLATPGGPADHELRWFTPTSEIAMCGHATLAAGHVLLGDDLSLTHVRFATRQAGVLEVRRADDGYMLDLPATGMTAATAGDVRVAPLLAALGVVDAPVFFSAPPVQETAVILLPDEAAVRALAPDMKALAAIRLMAICTAPGDRTDMVSRVFVPAWGVDEDPVTGSAHAALAPWWSARLGRPETTAHQASARGGDMRCRVAGDRVVLTGRCVTVIEGVFAV
ncbi:PhzF family phenazine biosynthesis protein [Sphingomonas montana]|uniref:PhzF family phenazine biosynthesis protein n=1 Tax=Sphingomonas montana TaxID=1843236 RepID=UPI00096E0253|nr:PhzF family phenazine biosynthesis protein [Sphingomonas montana]